MLDVIWQHDPADVLIRTTVFIWLMISTTIDITFGIRRKGFFYHSISVIKNNEENIRRSKCPSYKGSTHEGENCPVFCSLSKCLKHNDGECTPRSDVYMWNVIRRACVVRCQQANFFEFLAVQFVIVLGTAATAAMATGSNTFHGQVLYTASIVLLLAIILLIIPIIVISYVETKPLRVYENKRLRLLITFSAWVIIVFFLFLVNGTFLG